MSGLLEGWVAQISWNEKGFWQGDLFDGEADVPEAFFTMGRDSSRSAAIAKAQEKWPYAVVMLAIACRDCNGGTDADGEMCTGCGGEGVVVGPAFQVLP